MQHVDYIFVGSPEMSLPFRYSDIETVPVQTTDELRDVVESIIIEKRDIKVLLSERMLFVLRHLLPQWKKKNETISFIPLPFSKNFIDFEEWFRSSVMEKALGMVVQH
ncbi:hypothetical protein ACFL56_02215 [Candidatus Margulisiibacteriota bacterium]